MSDPIDKPCPFCWSDDLEFTDQPSPLEGDPSPPLRVIVCNNCGAQGPVAMTDAAAWQRWNRRDDSLWRDDDDG